VYSTGPKQHYPPEEEANRIFEEARKHWTPQYLQSEDVQRRVLAVVKSFEKVDHPEKVTPQSHLQKDLGLDSLDTLDLLMEIEDEFVVEVPDLELEKIRSVADAIKYFSSHPYAK
jgi:NADH dehydrogenase (ubiquinone) 1 alpha/beta subcomplex 1